MSETPQDPAGLPKLPIDTETVRETIDDVRQRAESVYNDAPPEVKQAVEKSQSFYQENKKVILTVATVYVAFRINKRMVRKATAKAVKKTLASSADVALTNNPEIETLEQIVQFLRETPGLTYIAKGGKMLHVLLENDKVLTFIDDFDRMTDAQINTKLFNYFTRTQGSLRPIK